MLKREVRPKIIKSPKKPLSSKNNDYDTFLRGNKKTETKTGSTNTDKKVIQVRRKRQSPRISLNKDIRDINDIEHKMITMKNDMNKIQVPTQNIKKETVNHIYKPVSKPVSKQISNNSSKKVRLSDIDVREKRSDEQLSEEKIVKQPVKQDVKLVKPVVKQAVSSNNRSNNRSKSRSRNRKISIKNKKLTDKDIQNVSKKMRELRSKKTDDIKQELESQGLKVSGKSDRLLKDIYLYSKVCNINIQYEK